MRNNQSDATIDTNLQKFGKHVSATCPHCAYSGPMGYDSFYHPVPRWVWVPLMIVGIFFGIIPGLIILWIAHRAKRFAAECPSCGQALRLKRNEAQPVDLQTARSSAPTLAQYAPEESGDDGDSICPLCKEEIRPGAVICKHCGSDLSSAALASRLTPQIREQLQSYTYVVDTRCLECGYIGPMGLVKQIKPLYQRGWFQFLFFMGFVRTLGALFWGSYFMNKPTQNIVVCPNCRKTLITQEPAAEKSLFLVAGR